MKNVIVKLIIVIIIPSSGALILYHLMFGLSYYVEEVFPAIEMEDGIPIYGLVAMLCFIVLFIISLKKKDAVKYYISASDFFLFLSLVWLSLSYLMENFCQQMDHL